MVQLEDDEIELNEVFPQGDEADTKWAFTVVGYVVSFFLGVICLGLSISWLLQVCRQGTNYLASLSEPFLCSV